MAAVLPGHVPGVAAEEGIAPPYMVSYKLMPADTAATVLPLQAWRYEVVTPIATLHGVGGIGQSQPLREGPADAK